MKKPAYILTVLFLIFMLDLYARTDRLQFKYITPDDGLSSSSITCFLQDSKGLMWIGTYYGLNRYDGFGFVVYSHNSADSNSLAHNFIYTLFEDHRDNLLVGTSEGLSLYRWEKDNFINYMHDSSSPLHHYPFEVTSIAEDTLGNLWLATENGLLYFDRESNQVVHYQNDPSDPGSLSHNRVEFVFIDSEKNLWAGTRKGLNLFQPETRTFQHTFFDALKNSELSDTYFMDMAEDENGDLWFGTYGSGLFCLKSDMRNKNRLMNYCHDPNNEQSLSADRIHSLFVDHQGDLWIGTENGGLNLFDREKNGFLHYRSDEYDPNSLNNESVYAIYQDNTENLWVGTFAGGVNFQNVHGNAVLCYRKLPGVATSLSNNSVTDFLEDSSGRIWIATDGGGINLFHTETGRFLHYNTQNSNLKSGAVLSMAEDSERQIWMGTWAGGLCRFDPKSNMFHSFNTQNSDIPDNNIFSVIIDRHGDLWMGSFQNGLIRYDRKTRHFSNYNSRNSELSINMVSLIQEIPDGRLLIGTPAGFFIFNPDNENCTPYFHDSDNRNSISAEGIHTFALENDTTVWIGTQNGLNRFDLKTERFDQYYKKDGLPDNIIQGLVFDESGKMWVSTNHGISRFDPSSGIYKNFTKADGLQSNEFHSNSAIGLRDGSLLFGGTKGFNIIYPERVTENKKIPKLLITDFRIFNDPVPVGVEGSPLKTHISETNELTLSYRQSVFTFQYAAMDFTIPEKNQYAYIMEGFDLGPSAWNYVGNKRSVTYTNLSPRTYTFRVKGSNNDGLWNEEGIAVKIRITPPFWGTIWFRVIVVLLVMGILFAGFQMRIGGIRNRNRELEQRVLERTAQLEETNKEIEAFAYSVSHDLRAPLRGMDGFSEILLEDYTKKIDEKGKDYLLRIRKASHRMSYLIDDLLRLFRLTRGEINFNEVDLSELFQSVIDEYKQTNPKRQIEIQIEKDIHVVGDRSLLKVMFQNLVDNALKFSKNKAKAKIAFGINRQNEESVYYVQDNGIGFDMDHSEKLFEPFQRQHAGFEGTGVGLATVKRIVLRHGGRIWAEGMENKGAIFYFTLEK